MYLHFEHEGEQFKTLEGKRDDAAAYRQGLIEDVPQDFF